MVVLDPRLFAMSLRGSDVDPPQSMHQNPAPVPTEVRRGRELWDDTDDEDEPPRQRPKRTDPEKEVRDTVARVIAEASMSAIEAEPSDLRAVNLLRSFRAQADVLGTLGVFDSPNTVIGKVLHDETGGHEQLLKTIDAHIARERAKEPVVDMGAYMKSRKPPESLPYHIFDDNDELKDLAIRRIGAELDSIDAIERVLDASWESEDVDERIDAEMKVQATKILKAERSLRDGVVRATDALLVANPARNYTGRWSLEVNDPEYARLAKEHKKQLYGKPQKAPAPAATDAKGGVLPPPEQVTGSLWDWVRGLWSDYEPDEEIQRNEQDAAARASEARQAELQRLRGRFTEQQVNLLETGEFVENVGGVVDYVLAFGKYSWLEHTNNKVQAGLTALPITLGIMAATGTAGITMPWAVAMLVLSNTVKGVLNRLKRKEPVSPPALRKLFKFVKENKEYALASAVLGMVPTGGLVSGWVLEAFHEYELLGLLYRSYNQPGILGTNLGRTVNSPREVVEIATRVREAARTVADEIGRMGEVTVTAPAALELEGGRAAQLATPGWTRSIGADSIRDAVDAVWSGSLDWLGNLAGGLLIAGSTVCKIVSFETDCFRPDRARLYLYMNDPENDGPKHMMEEQAWALPALSILYEGNENRRGDQRAPRTNIDNPKSVKEWLPAKRKEALKSAKDWKDWYTTRQTGWHKKSPRMIIRNAKNVATWVKPIREMSEDFTDPFRIVPIMRTGMTALKANWEAWKVMWTTMKDMHSGRSGNISRLVDCTSTDDVTVTAENITKSWYMLYKVLEYQHAYVTGGRNPSYTTDVYFDAWAHNLSTPRHTDMLTEIVYVFPKAKAQSELPFGGRRQILLEKFDSLHDSAELNRIFERYYPAAQNLDWTIPLRTQTELDELVKRVTNLAGAQGDQLGMGPIVADGPGAGGAGVQASVVDEVYARVSALRL